MDSLVPSFSLQGRVIVQFGGTGLLGRALVAALAGCGAQLVVASRNRAALEGLAGQEGQAGRQVAIEEVDIGQEASLQALRDRLLARHGRIDGIVFNAVSRPMRSLQDDLARWNESMATNATGLFATARVFAEAMAGAGKGSVVFIASHMGLVGVQPWLYADAEPPMGLPPPDYFFHKGGMLNLTRYLACYYGPKGVRVNVVSPGGIFNPDRPQPEKFRERYAQATALGRMADAREVGGAVVYLLSEASSYVTGANLMVDGGYTAK